MITPDYLKPLTEVIRNHENAEQAIRMKKYMKNQFEFFGIPSPKRKEIYRQHWKEHGYIPDNQKEKVLKLCWNAPQRELQYFAMETLGRKAGKATVQEIELYEYMITNKSWWDTVDYIAANLAGMYFRLYPEKINAVTDRWIESGNLWLRRSCLLFQLKYKNDTDTQLLEHIIDPLVNENEFFIRKAIGWILREYSKTNPEYVMRYVNNHKLSGLSEREALKWIKNRSSSNNIR
jgi:3-methyladenine DNA glycosylase AlkD